MPRENHCGECCCLKGNIEERACQLALYIIENKATVRSAAQRFGISKSTVHKDLSERLPAFNKPLYLQVKQVLDENKAERHIRGGIATRKKYRGVISSAGALVSVKRCSVVKKSGRTFPTTLTFDVSKSHSILREREP